MKTLARQVRNIAEQHHGVVAGWQLQALGWSVEEVKAGLRGLRRVHRGVCALGDLTELGWYMAAALAMGPTGAVSHLSALMLTGLRPYRPIDIEVSHRGGGRGARGGLRVHRNLQMQVETWRGIPVTTPTQSLKDTPLEPHELYRALEEAEKRGLRVDLVNDVVQLNNEVRGFTRSDTEAAFLWLVHEHDLPLPLVNHVLNGYEADFSWPPQRLVVEVDGFQHHRDKPNFDEDRYRGLVHAAAGWEVVRVSADHVYDHPRLVLAALSDRL